ncbi:hypothetical protein I307_00792 [Cryptococcus deuterogattii 99/473]|uniref:Uncharacterized protein n=1 Tax=Cryptococcus deuterogattii Ram5 TaxID=1296110 RepID=A0A0D0VBW2_9TREE|nr:hypothetical protein I309_00302 [Cryptococcus deuterogattii LA55]KIR35584.1 hypothetical protein I352_01860 [Cryptococcus deuterogattii MMRL2647]KIR42315.1 hypothetical protein I313_01538 [Cryptococcus deuterogattii Ram5]KIR72860.1 hypothetical protein I310_03463 [Cryptococcus deuterogattii CA1014]KIR94959.1 hypothetical protein I304_01284 [Cryptococcus deuterogattii CBS 10090]KIS00519.1 hypothetical protein L804_01933 [Cryptococcus deuterogattii 2001/935-1]KIY59719.1 hypothetical protein 
MGAAQDYAWNHGSWTLHATFRTCCSCPDFVPLPINRPLKGDVHLGSTYPVQMFFDDGWSLASAITLAPACIQLPCLSLIPLKMIRAKMDRGLTEQLGYAFQRRIY